MCMYYANDKDKNLTHINDVERGLTCYCTYLQCDELLIARKGKKRRHHFAHASLKKSCNIKPESALHKYAKEVVFNKLHLTLPANPAWDLDSKSGVDFSSIKMEKSIDSIRPNLTGNLYNSQQKLYIEIVVTNPPNDEKIERINQLALDTVEIDLQEMLQKKIHFPSKRAEDYIIGTTHNKKWIYPSPNTIDEELPSVVTLPKTPLIDSTLVKNEPAYKKFKIYGMWVNAIIFEDNNISVKSSYNPQLVKLFKHLR